MNDTRQRMWRALPFVMAMLLAAMIPLNAYALFGRKAAEPETAAGAPIARNMEIKAYRGVAYTGTLTATDSEGEAVTFHIATLPAKGTLEFGEEGVFVYTPDANKAGSDSFTFTAVDESGNVSAPATVKIKIARVSSGVDYADTDLLLQRSRMRPLKNIIDAVGPEGVLELEADLISRSRCAITSSRPAARSSAGKDR